MKPQATRYTSQEWAYLAYWESRGYTFAPGEKPPTSTLTPPSLATRRPILDAVLGAAVLVIGVGGMLALWIEAGPGL